MSSAFAWRPMRADDVDAVAAVAAVAFPDHFEDRACFEERLALFPAGCFVLASTAAVKGYLIAYPWPLGEIPPLNSPLGRLPEERAALYLHDLALGPAMRGLGHVRPILAQLGEVARTCGARRIALVSVNESASFWQRMGFQPRRGDPAITSKLASYGDDATYMIREL